METSDFKKMMEVHFEDDKKSFAKIYELIGINGEHFSHFNDKLTIILKNQKEQDVKSEEYRNEMKSHMKRVEPMISSYETDTNEQKVLGDIGNKWGLRVKKIGAIAAALAAIGVVISWVISHFKIWIH